MSLILITYIISLKIKRGNIELLRLFKQIVSIIYISVQFRSYLGAKKSLIFRKELGLGVVNIKS